MKNFQLESSNKFKKSNLSSTVSFSTLTKFQTTHSKTNPSLLGLSKIINVKSKHTHSEKSRSKKKRYNKENKSTKSQIKQKNKPKNKLKINKSSSQPNLIKKKQQPSKKKCHKKDSKNKLHKKSKPKIGKLLKKQIDEQSIPHLRISKIQELTDRKKNHQQYFMYKNKCIPIENTEQRKIIFQIKFIDERSQNYSTSQRQPIQRNQKTNQLKAITQNKQNLDQLEKQLKDQIQKQKLSHNSCQENKANIITSDKAINVVIESKQEKQQRQCQTQDLMQSNTQEINLNDENGKLQKEKCFIETLSELEFLYLPDSSNFQGFTQAQKVHYKELLLYMAKKFQTRNSQQSEMDQETVEILLNQREQKQRGAMASNLQNGIPTHSPSIISYLSNLFCFLELHEKKTLVTKLNSSFGYSIQEKLRLIKKKKPTQRHCRLVTQSTFWSFEEQLHQGLQFQNELVEQSLHYHNRALFDCVNQFIQEFQPYYPSNGQPFPWSYNLQTTFYCIDDDSFSALATQIKQKIWQCSQTLAGIYLDKQTDDRQKQQPVKHKSHIHRILASERAMLLAQNKKYSDKIELDEGRTQIMLNLSDILEQALIQDLILDIQSLTKIIT